MSPKELREPKLKPMTLAQYEARKRALEEIAARFRDPDGSKWAYKSKPCTWRYCVVDSLEC